MATNNAINGQPFTFLGETILGSANATITLSGLTAKKHLYVEIYLTGKSATTADWLTLNNDTGANYDYSKQLTSGARSVSTGQAKAVLDNTGANAMLFRINIVNIAANIKLGIGDAISATIDTWNMGFNWNNTADQITRIDINSDGGAQTYGAGSYIAVWGTD